MKKPLLAASLTTGLMAATAAPVLSHHSHAMFNHSDAVTITGTVTQVSFRNPHVFVYLDVEDEEGAVVAWIIEMSNIQNTIRRGIRASTFDVGDVVTATVYPLENGGSGGSYLTITAADGTTYE